MQEDLKESLFGSARGFCAKSIKSGLRDLTADFLMLASTSSIYQLQHCRSPESIASKSLVSLYRVVGGHNARDKYRLRWLEISLLELHELRTAPTSFLTMAIGIR
jgi:hypothetical protein